MHNEEQLDQSNPRFRERVAELAAPLHGVSKDELVGEHVRQHRRTIRLARAAVAGLTMLAIATTGASAIALVQRNAAREQARIALARQAAATAVASTGTRLDLAQLLSVAAYHLDRTPQATAALFRAVGESPHLVRYLQAGAAVSALASSMDGSVIAAGTDDGRVLTWDLRTGRHTENHLANRQIHAVALDVRGDRIAATDGVHAQVWQRTGNSPPVVLAAAARRPADLVALSPLGTAVAVLYQESADNAPSKPALLALYGSASGGVQLTATGQVALDFVDFSSESTVTTGSFDGRHSAWTLSGHRLAPTWNMTLSPAPFNNYLSAHAQGGAYYAYVKDGSVTTCHLPWTDGPCSGGGVPTAAMEATAISPDGRHAAVAAAGVLLGLGHRGLGPGTGQQAGAADRDPGSL